MTAEGWALLMVLGWILASGAFVWWVLYRMPPMEVAPEERCPACSRWLGHRWRCPLR